MHFQVEVSAIDQILARLATAGVAPGTPVSECWYRVGTCEHGQREFFVADPDGYLFRFFEFLGERPA